VLDAVFDLWSSEHRADPHTLYRQMRSVAPVYEGIGPETGRSFWFLTRYDDVLDAFRDPRLGREVDRLPAALQTQHRLEGQELMAVVNTHLLNMDPPDHTRLRRLVSSTFTPRRIRELEPRIVEISDDLLSDLGDEADLIGAYAMPIPVIVIAELLGVPIGDLDRFRSMVDAFLRAESQEASLAAGMEMIQYINESIEYRKENPGSDLLSALIHLEEDGDRLDHAELMSMVSLLLIAGHETTVNLIGNGMIELMRHRDQLRQLLDTPELIDSTIEEMVRFNGPVETSFPRVVYEDIEIGGVGIPQGDMVIPVLLSANRDPDHFEGPDTFDIARDPNKHVGFGFGVHYCLGAPLARLEARIAISKLLDRYPDIDFAVDPAELEWQPGFFLRGVKKLPVRTA
jgi:cytochrome P450